MDKITWEMCKNITELTNHDIVVLDRRLTAMNHAGRAQRKQRRYWLHRVACEMLRRDMN